MSDEERLCEKCGGNSINASGRCNEPGCKWIQTSSTSILKVRLDMRSKELPRGGSSMATSFETSMVNITSKCVLDLLSQQQRKIEVQVNQHHRVGESYESFDLKISGAPEVMAELAKQIQDGVDQWRRMLGVAGEQTA